MKTKGTKLTKAVVRPAKASPTRFHIKSVLVPLDFSQESKKALAYAVPFAEQFGAKLTLLHVVEPVATPDFAATLPLALENDKVMAVCKGKLEHLIKEQAIVVSTHGRTGLKHVFLGRVAENVVRHAPCPVLVVREREHEFLAN